MARPGHVARWVAVGVAGALACVSGLASAGTLYVWQASPDPTPPYTNWVMAARNIQRAVDAAQPGDTVLVTNGTYAKGGRAVSGTMTNRVAVDKPVTVRSVNGPAVTTIEGHQVPGMTNGEGAIRCVYLADGAVLSGFTLTGGATRIAGDAQERYGGGILCQSTNALVTHCTLTANSASLSGGGAHDGMLDRCTLTSNSAPYGGGAARGVLNRCILKGNTASWGGGAYHAGLDQCRLEGNRASSSGGGAYSGTLSQCALIGNAATGPDGVGGGAYSGTLNHCTLTGNSASVSGGGAGHAGLNNCILYDNTTTSGSGPNYVGGALHYCCTAPLPGTGTGNISIKPQLASASHLSASSPCRGAGSAPYAIGSDIDGEAWANPPSMGCDEFWPGSVSGPLRVSLRAAYTNVAVGFPVAVTAEIEGRTGSSRWDFGDGTVVSNRPFAHHAWALPGDHTVRLTAFNDDHPAGVSATLVIRVVEAVHYVALGSPAPKAPYLSWARAARTIQEAVDAATVPGARVLVTNGVYATGGRPIYGVITNRVAVDKAVRVESVNGPAVTLIRGYHVPGMTNGIGAVRCVYLTNGAVLAGFTLTNGATGYSGDYGHHEREETGGGVWCESTNALVTNCTLTGNSAYVAGGALSGTLNHCTLTGNSAHYTGGAHNATLNQCTITSNSATGIFGSGGGAESCTLNYCTLTGNWARHKGGGVSWGTLNHCTLTGNSAAVGGGNSGGTLNHCTLTGNSAGLGGGAFFGTLNTCTLVGNSALGSGGGAYHAALNTCLLTDNSADMGGGACYGTLNHCTLTGNSASSYGGGFYTDTHNYATLVNCIVYYNTALAGDANYSGGTVNFSCTTPLPPRGTGNLSAEPQLASSSHLSAASPCRGAGSAQSSTALDIDGEPWADPPSIGCDEYSSGAATGPLRVGLQSAHTNGAVGFVVILTGQIEGRASAHRWRFGDGTVVSNRLHAQHAWRSPGDYTVRLTAFNQDHPEGVSATVTVRVVAQPVHYVIAGSAAPTAPYTSWATAARTIQKAVNAASVPGALVLVSNGVYATGGKAVQDALTNRVAVDKPVQVKSVNGPAATVIVGGRVPGTIHGEGAVRCVYLTNGAVLSGFTLTNGATASSGDPERKRKGGGVWCASADALVTNCVLAGNSAYDAGGGAYSGTLKNCTLTGNSASVGGGSAGGTLNNCTLMGNFASYAGGAYSGTLNNCTLTGNSAEYGGGARSAALNNCIVYYNTATSYPNCPSEYDILLNYSCTTPLPSMGSGNIAAEPLFMDRANGNLRLQSNSPCVNAGNNACVPGRTDLDGRPRIVGGAVDIGAYEFQGPGFSQFIPWLANSGLPTDGSADYSDPDSDRLNNWQEWQADTDPTNALSVLRIDSISAGPPVTLQFTSSSNRLYTLRYATNVTEPSWTDLPGLIDVPGSGGLLTLRETHAAPPRLYRVGVRVP